jgi:hypothetical protein
MQAARRHVSILGLEVGSSGNFSIKGFPLGGRWRVILQRKFQQQPDRLRLGQKAPPSHGYPELLNFLIEILRETDADPAIQRIIFRACVEGRPDSGSRG